MKEITDQNKRDIFEWFSWLNKKWNSYEAFNDFDFGSNPKEVAEKFFDLNREEFQKSFESFDKDDLDAIDQLQKLTESESHVFKIIRQQIDYRNKVRFVDFTKKRIHS